VPRLPCGSLRRFDSGYKTIEHMRMANALCRFVEDLRTTDELNAPLG
jgi:hypothetical protein